MKITEVESFRVKVPLTEQQHGTAGYYNSTGITRVRTDEGFTENFDNPELSGWEHSQDVFIEGSLQSKIQ